jgi:Spy/CpxP family protein refolding chaperone
MGVPQRGVLASEGQLASVAAIAKTKGGLRRIKFKASIMNILRLLAVLAMPFSLTFPIAAQAQPAATTVAQMSSASPSTMKTDVVKALQGCNLTMQQKMQIKPMVTNYQSETTNADAATKKSAQEKLLKEIYGVLTPEQQTEFKASLKSSLGSSASP